MAIDLRTLQQKWDALLDDPNFVSDFQVWLNNREKRLSDEKKDWVSEKPKADESAFLTTSTRNG
jgi:hypothetical protein